MFTRESYIDNRNHSDKPYYTNFKKNAISPYSENYDPFNIIEDAVHRRNPHNDIIVGRNITENTGELRDLSGQKNGESKSVIFNIYQKDESKSSLNSISKQTNGKLDEFSNISFNITNNINDQKYRTKKSKRKRDKNNHNEHNEHNEQIEHIGHDEHHEHDKHREFTELMKSLYDDIGGELENILKYYVDGSDELNDILEYENYSVLADKLYESRVENNELFEQFRQILIAAITGVKNNNDRKDASNTAYEILKSSYEQLQAERSNALKALTVSETLDTCAIIKVEIQEYIDRGYKLVDERGSVIPINMDIIAQIRNEIACNRLIL